MIDLSEYDKWTDIPDKICSCENILSGSLHGLIMSEAYNIPNVWIQFGEPLIGEHFKFHDFFMSIGCDREQPMYISNNNILIEDINLLLSSWTHGYIDLQLLVDSCPFELKDNILQ